MKCEKCGGQGFIEENHGLLMVACDCEAGAREREELGIPVREDVDEEDEDESLSDIVAEANAFANALMPKLEGEVDGNTIDNRVKPDNQPTGSVNPREPKLKRKSKTKKKARA